MDQLLSVWGFHDKTGERVYPYKGVKGKVKGYYSVNRTKTTRGFRPMSEFELIESIRLGKSRDRGTIRMRPLGEKAGSNAFAPVEFDGKPVKSY